MRTVLRIAASLAIVSAAAAGVRWLCWIPYQCNRVAAEMQSPTDAAYASADPLLARRNLERLLPHVERCPRNLYLRVLAGGNYQTLGRREDAAEMFSAALRYHRRPELYVWLGSAQFELGQTDEGLANTIRGAMFAPSILEKIPPSVVRQRAYERIAEVMSAAVTVRNADFSAPSSIGPKTYEGHGAFGPSAARNWNVYAALSSARTELVPSTRRPGRTMLRVVTGGPDSGIIQSWGRAGLGPAKVRTEVWIYVVSGAVQTGSGAPVSGGTHAYTRQTGVWQRVEGLSTTCPVSETLVLSLDGPAEFYVDEVKVTPVPGECLR